ncbi:PiggyBac transposable element-derived protein 3 [Plakobranchus ocellatus]|uniref:PiggyBac transposable element-derived protein 3 n=1 Tax=Plakobranchus ocellatus TaxID=259542 RepID=A0AAV4BWB1_9GAST|nr:PiggyBac transposable element-derived protein 3 [Plakobranchus ocellatus]
MYWSPETEQDLVCDSMTCNRFEKILSIEHLNDNDLMRPRRGGAGYDRLFRVRPLIEKLNIQFEACAEKEMWVSVDEQIIPFKGRHSLKVYMMKKPKKWGYKVWVMTRASGYVHKFVFAGNYTSSEKKAVEEGLNKGKIRGNSFVTLKRPAA